MTPATPPLDPLAEVVRAALSAGEAARAQAAVAAALAGAPDDLGARHLESLARHWVALGADLDLARAVRLGPESFAVHLELANRLAARGDAPAAAACLKLAARLDYTLSPDKRRTMLGPFNGQFIRQKIFLTLNARLDFQAVFETGSYRGDTTVFLAEQVSCPVRSCELLSFIYELAVLRLDEFARSGARRAAEVTLDNLDSRAFLRRRLPELAPGAPLFCYLDAHCTGELPIAAECALILEHGPPTVIMIDDVDVPDDPGFRPVGLRPGDFVGLADLAPVFHRFDGAFFPTSSAEETGMRRGSLLLTTSPELTACLAALPELRRVPPALAPARP
jgi:hypothetical protein